MRTCPVYLAAGSRLPIEHRDEACRGTLYFAGYSFQPQPSVWARAGSTLQRWLCSPCHLCHSCCDKQDDDVTEDDTPRVNHSSSTLHRWLCSPCHLCHSCCDKQDDDVTEEDTPRLNQATATAERLSRPRRPHAPGSRKSTPEMLTAVRCALSQLQGEPAPPPPDSPEEGQELG